MIGKYPGVVESSERGSPCRRASSFAIAHFHSVQAPLRSRWLPPRIAWPAVHVAFSAESRVRGECRRSMFRSAAFCVWFSATPGWAARASWRGQARARAGSRPDEGRRSCLPSDAPVELEDRSGLRRRTPRESPVRYGAQIAAAGLGRQETVKRAGRLQWSTESLEGVQCASALH